MSSALVFGVWHDIKTCDLQEAIRGWRDEGGRWSLEGTCVWEPSVIHTLLITIHLCSIQSLRHFTERGALLGVLWVFVSENYKKPPVDQQLYISFVSIWLIMGSSFIHLLICFSDPECPAWRNKSKESQLFSPGSNQNKTMLTWFQLSLSNLFCLTEASAYLESCSLVMFRYTCGSKWITSWRGLLLSTKEPIRAPPVLNPFVKDLRVTTEWSQSSQLHANYIIHTS